MVTGNDVDDRRAAEHVSRLAKTHAQGTPIPRSAELCGGGTEELTDVWIRICSCYRKRRLLLRRHGESQIGVVARNDEPDGAVALADVDDAGAIVFVAMRRVRCVLRVRDSVCGMPRGDQMQRVLHDIKEARAQ